MKARALVIGNSHVASLVPVWRRGGERNVDLDFLAAHGTNLSWLVAIDPRTTVLRVCGKSGLRKPTKPMVPDAAKDRGYLELEAYSATFIYGLQLLTSGVMQNNSHAGDHPRGPDKWFDLLESSNSGLSRRAWQMAARDFVRNTLHYNFVSQFPAVIRDKMICLPCPFPNNCLPRARAVAHCGKERVDEALDIMAEELQALGVRFSRLPSTLTDSSGYLTASEYMKDPVHLNAQGAQIVLSFISKLVSETV